MATEMPPRRPPHVRILITFGLNVRKGFVKIDAVEKSQRIFLQTESQRSDHCDPQGSQKRDDHYPDSGGQLDEIVKKIDLV